MPHFRGTVVHNRYEVQGQIGAGASGFVYRAEDRQTSKIVALKQLRADMTEPDQPRRFQQESDLLKTLSHPSIPAMIEAFAEEDGLYVAMEFIDGPSLDNVVRQQGTFTAQRTLECAAQVCDILQYLHSQPVPILHRDVKPQNIIQRSEDGQIVLVDFGIARSLSAHRNSSAGTLGYAPLEQIQGRPERRSDLYALGITMYYLLVGQTPQLFESTPSIESALRGKIQPEVAFIVNMACQHHANQRYQSAERMAIAIRRALKSMIEPVAVETPGEALTSDAVTVPPKPKSGCLGLVTIALLPVLYHWLHR